MEQMGVSNVSDGADESPERERQPETQDLDPRLNDLSEYQQCFACGFRNEAGLHLVFRHEGDDIVTEYTPAPHFRGFPGVVHGGILATLLDEALSRTASAEGRWMMTAKLELRYRQPAPLGRPLRVAARAITSRSRLIQATGEIRLADEPETVIAEAQGTFMAIPKSYQQESVRQFPELASFFEL